LHGGYDLTLEAIMNELKKKPFQVIVFIELHFILQEIGSLRAENYKQNMEIAAF